MMKKGMSKDTRPKHNNDNGYHTHVLEAGPGGCDCDTSQLPQFQLFPPLSSSILLLNASLSCSQPFLQDSESIAPELCIAMKGVKQRSVCG